jgi:putative endonuclease
MAAQAAIHARLRGLLRVPIMGATGPRHDSHQGTTVIKEPCVYIAASKRDGVLYIGVTGDLAGRMAEHDQALVEGFTKRHGVKRLVYYEFHDSFEAAILRETRLKKWKRAWKVRLIESMNPEWISLFDATSGQILFGPADAVREQRP